jgi:hypothetical protein
MHNPYVVGRIVTDRQFYNQDALLRELVPFDANAYLLTGLRRVGKSSILKEVVRRVSLQPGLAPICVSLQGRKSSQAMAQQFCHGVEDWLADHGRVGGVTLDPNAGLTASIQAWIRYCKQQNLQSHLLLDECEELQLLDETTLIDLHQCFRENTIHLKVILAGSRAVFTDRRTGYMDLLDFFTRKTVSLFSEADAASLVIQTKSGQVVQVETDTLGLITQHCGGHPYLIQWACYKLFQTAGHSLRQAVPEDFIPDVSINSFLKVDFDLLSTAQQAILTELLRCQSCTREQLASKLSINLGLVREAIVELLTLGVLRQTGQSYQIAYHIFAEWIRAHQVILPEEYHDTPKEEPPKTEQKTPLVVTLFAPDTTAYLSDLKTNCLNGFQTRGTIQHWDTDQLRVGAKREQETREKIQAADVVIGLISVSYFNDPEVTWQHKLALVLGKTFIPVIATTGYYEDYPEIRDANPWPREASGYKPIDSWSNRNAAYADIAKRLGDFLRE